MTANIVNYSLFKVYCSFLRCNVITYCHLDFDFDMNCLSESSTQIALTHVCVAASAFSMPRDIIRERKSYFISSPFDCIPHAVVKMQQQAVWFNYCRYLTEVQPTQIQIKTTNQPIYNSFLLFYHRFCAHKGYLNTREACIFIAI